MYTYIYIYIYIYIIYIWCGKPPFANHFPLETHGFPFFVFCYDLEGITCFFTQFHMGLFEHWILQNPLVNHPEIPNKKLDHSYFIPISNMSCWFNDFPSYKPALIFMRYFPIWFPLFSQEFTIFTHSFRYFSRRFLIFSPKTSSRFSCIFPIFSPYFPYFPIFFPYFSHLSLGFPRNKAMIHRGRRSACRARSASSSSPACSGARVITPRPLEAIQRTYVGEKNHRRGNKMRKKTYTLWLWLT